MAQVYVTRGDLDRALALYQESLQLMEQIGDLQGKAASLHEDGAGVPHPRRPGPRPGPLPGELAVMEQIGDLKGKAASLHKWPPFT